MFLSITSLLPLPKLNPFLSNPPVAKNNFTISPHLTATAKSIVTITVKGGPLKRKKVVVSVNTERHRESINILLPADDLSHSCKDAFVVVVENHNRADNNHNHRNSQTVTNMDTIQKEGKD